MNSETIQDLMEIVRFFQGGEEYTSLLKEMSDKVEEYQRLAGVVKTKEQADTLLKQAQKDQDAADQMKQQARDILAEAESQKEKIGQEVQQRLDKLLEDERAIIVAEREKLASERAEVAQLRVEAETLNTEAKAAHLKREKDLEDLQVQLSKREYAVREKEERNAKEAARLKDIAERFRGFVEG